MVDALSDEEVQEIETKILIEEEQPFKILEKERRTIEVKFDINTNIESLIQTINQKQVQAIKLLKTAPYSYLGNVGQIIKKCPSIVEIDISGFNYAGRYLSDLAEIFAQFNITHFHWSGNKFQGNESELKFIQFITEGKTKISHLHLSKCLGRLSFYKLIESFSKRTCTLKYLNISHNKNLFSNNKDLEFLLKHLGRNRTLTGIDLTETGITKAGVRKIVELLPKTRLVRCIINGQNLCDQIPEHLRQPLEDVEDEVESSESSSELDSPSDLMELDATEKRKKLIERLHYFIYDINLDAIPIILKSLKKATKFDLVTPNEGKVPAKITIIKPSQKPPSDSISDDDEVNKGLLALLKDYADLVEVSFKEERSLPRIAPAHSKELRIYIGETINCSATSRITKGKRGNKGDGDDDLSAYHLTHLKTVKDYISPDIILSENHTFPYLIEKKINAALNGEEHDKDDYYIHYEKVQHAAYTQELRSRIYLVASKTFIKPGSPLEVESRLKPVRSYPEISSEPKNVKDHPVKSQLQLWKDIMANISAGMPHDGLPSEFKLEPLYGKLTLYYKGEKYWLNVDPDTEQYGIYVNSLVFFNAQSGDIRIVKREKIAKDSSWMQSRFFYDSNQRVCKTITSLDTFGTNTWGVTFGKLSPYELSRVHGCSKAFSKIIHDAYGFAKNPGAANRYVGHAYSSKVVSHLLLSSIWKYVQPDSDYATEDYPTRFTYESATPAELRSKILQHRVEGSQLAVNKDSIYLVDSNRKRLSPHMRWVRITPELEEEFSIEEYMENQEEVFAEDTQKLNSFLHDNRERLAELLETIKAGKPISLLPHQLEGIQWMLDQRLAKKKGGILGDDMGLGKTIQSVMYSLLIRKCASYAGCHLPRPILIILPLRLIETWKKEFGKFLDNPADPITVLRTKKDWDKVTAGKEDQLVFDRIFIATNEFVQDHSHLIKEVPFDSIIVDEAQKMRNPDSVLSANLKNLSYNSEFRLCLSGTPLENSETDIINLLQFIEPLLPIKIKSTYSQRDRQDLRNILKAYMLRRTKDHIDLGLPQKKHIIHVLQPTPLQKQIYDLVDQDFGLEKRQRLAEIINSILVCDHPHVLNPGVKERLSSIISTEQWGEIKSQKFPKIEKLLEILKERYPHGYDRKRDKPTVIFSSYIKVLKLVEKHISESGIFKTKKIKLVHGETSQDEFNQVMTNFDEGSVPVLLINLKQGKGLNLQKSDFAILFEPWWNPQLEKQAEDRIYRIGQKSDVTIVRFHLAGTVEDESIDPTQKEKITLFDHLIDGKTSDPEPLDLEFFAELPPLSFPPIHPPLPPLPPPLASLPPVPSATPQPSVSYRSQLPFQIDTFFGSEMVEAQGSEPMVLDLPPEEDQYAWLDLL